MKEKKGSAENKIKYEWGSKCFSFKLLKMMVFLNDEQDNRNITKFKKRKKSSS